MPTDVLNATGTGTPTTTSEVIASDMSIDDISHWPGNAYTRANKAAGATPASTDTFVIYNNKAADTPKPYTEVYAESSR